MRKEIISNTANRLLNTVLVFLITVLLTRIIGASDFGVLTLMIANASVLNLISSLGISSGITFNIASKSLHERNILSITFFLLLAQLFFSTIFELGWFQFNNSFFVFKGDAEVQDFPGNYTQFRLWEKDEEKKAVVAKQVVVNNEKNKGEYKTYQDAGNDREIERKIAAFNPNVAR